MISEKFKDEHVGLNVCLYNNRGGWYFRRPRNTRCVCFNQKLYKWKYKRKESSALLFCIMERGGLGRAQEKDEPVKVNEAFHEIIRIVKVSSHKP